jgi:hypothetical protein
MASIGCTLVNKNRGVYCEVSLTYSQGQYIGRWDRLKNSVRSPGKYTKNLDFGDSGELVQSRDSVDGKDKSFMSIYAPGAVSGMRDQSITPPIVHIFCGSWDTVIERVTCGTFVSGKAMLYRTREDIEFELWYGCI